MIFDGAQVVTADGRRGRVGRFLGEGGQGVVHEIIIDGDSETLACKWYFDHTATRTQRQAIESLVSRGTPGPDFLWPEAIVERPGDQSFGYVMALRPQLYASLSDLLKGRVSVDFSTVCTLGVKLASSFLALHNDGLCYRDISFGNLFFDPGNGRPLICDNDNVGIEGASDSAVLGTRRFMAPEIVRREALPSARTDLYSLSVLFFYILMVGHPLVGRRELNFPCWDEDAELEMFGRHPLFVFDANDPSNAPVSGLHQSVLDYWPLYPQRIHDLFQQAFTRGLAADAHSRVAESVWRKALANLRDSIHQCPWCKSEGFWNPAIPDRQCWSCGRLTGRPLMVELNGYRIVLNEATTITRHHLAHDYTYDQTIAEVAQNPSNPNVWGLRNVSAKRWTVELPDGNGFEVDPMRSVSLFPGALISFGGATGEIVIA